MGIKILLGWFYSFCCSFIVLRNFQSFSILFFILHHTYSWVLNFPWCSLFFFYMTIAWFRLQDKHWSVTMFMCRLCYREQLYHHCYLFFPGPFLGFYVQFCGWRGCSLNTTQVVPFRAFSISFARIFVYLILKRHCIIIIITETMGIEILIFGNQNGLRIQRKPNFGPKIECTDDGISARWVKIWTKLFR